MARMSVLTCRMLHNGMKSNSDRRPLGGYRVSIVQRRDDTDVISPGSLVEVRDETWLVTSIDVTDDGPLYSVRGVTEFVEGTTASFYGSLGEVRALRPEDTRVVADSSPRYRSARLWGRCSTSVRPERVTTLPSPGMTNPVSSFHQRSGTGFEGRGVGAGCRWLWE